MSKQANVRQYYQQFEEQQTQSLIDQKVKEHLGQTAAAFAQQQIGGPFHQQASACPWVAPTTTNSANHTSSCSATAICTFCFRYTDFSQTLRIGFTHKNPIAVFEKGSKFLKCQS
jgi:hypothetical protein